MLSIQKGFNVCFYSFDLIEEMFFDIHCTHMRDKTNAYKTDNALLKQLDKQY